MAPRPTGTVVVYFKKVAVPCRTYPAWKESPKLEFKTLHRACGSRVKQQYLCPRDNTVMGEGDTVKGYEVAKDRFVIFEAEDLEKICPEPDPAIDIAELVDEGDIDPVYWGRPSYLGPDAGGEEAYALLADVLRLTGKVALAKWATRGRDVFVGLRASAGRIVLQEIRREEEIRDISEIEVAPAAANEPMLQLALKVADVMTADAFRPDTYPDERLAKTLELVNAKVVGKQIVASPPEGRPAAPIDLVEALKASMPELGERCPPKPATKDAGKTGGERRPKRAVR